MCAATSYLQVQDLSKTYSVGGQEVQALAPVSFDCHAGELILIKGPSGSGKSTLLRMLGCLLTPSTGNCLLDGVIYPRPASKAGAKFRATNIGYIFQEFAVEKDLTVSQNVAVPLEIVPRRQREQYRTRVDTLVNYVGLSHRANALAATLSGGEKQRTATARALVLNPPLILADEPTASLDKENSQNIAQLLARTARDGHCVVVATHTEIFDEVADAVLFLGGANKRGRHAA